MAKAQSPAVVEFLHKLDDDDIDVVHELTKLSVDELEELSQILDERRSQILEN